MGPGPGRGPFGESVPAWLYQEDACQLLGRYPADKYRLAFGEIAQALEVCTAPMVERLLQLQALSYLIAYGDLHAKNISVQVAREHIRLTPTYDLLSTLPYGDGDLALPLEGRDKKLERKHFLACGERIGIRPAATNHMLDALIKGIVQHLSRLHQLGLSPPQDNPLGTHPATTPARPGKRLNVDRITGSGVCPANSAHPASLP